MPRCAAFKPDGTPCERIVGAQRKFCFSHDPLKAKARRKVAAKGGRLKGTSAEVAGLKEEVRGVISKVEGGSLNRNDAAVMIQGYRTLRDFIELQRRVKETEEFAARLARLEGGSPAG